MSRYSYANKQAMVRNMGGGDSRYQALLNGLSTKEILILRQHPDLIDAVQNIIKMTSVQLLAELKEEYDLEADQHPTQDMYISTEKLEVCIPDWFLTDHSGWFVSSGDNFQEWARSFLMQEVRMNIWLRYLEHKKGRALYWTGSGSNYI